MTEQQIKEMKDLRKYVYHDLPNNHAKALKYYQNKLNSIVCDHKYPDGKSAIEGGPFCSVCNLCSWSDL